MTLIESQNEEKARLLALGLAKMKRKAELNVEGFVEKQTQADIVPISEDLEV